MSCNKQARARLVEIAIDVAARPKCRDCDGTGNYMLGTAPNACGACDGSAWRPMADAFKVRHRAGMNPCKGPWAAAGITAAMEDAGLVVPSLGTPARRQSIALLDFAGRAGVISCRVHLGDPHGLKQDDVHKAVQVWAEPGDLIAWLQHPPPNPAGWRRGHVAVIVAVDDESITTVGWGEGPAPGRVMKRRLWRDPEHEIPVPCTHPSCSGCVRMPRPAETVMARKLGLLYGIARPVARS
jgi:hypothetical protein